MKKAKFVDEFKMIAGACLGHFDDVDRQCKQCLLKQLCEDRSTRRIYPRNQRQVAKVIKKYLDQKNEA